MRSEPARARGPSPLVCYLWLATASAVTVATSSGRPADGVEGTFRVESDCPGATRTGVLEASFGARSRAVDDPVATPKPTATPVPTPQYGTAPGASKFGFPSDTFTSGDSEEGEWIVESRAFGRACKAAVDLDEVPVVLGFACRDERTEELQCVITLRRESEAFRSRSSGANEHGASDGESAEGSSRENDGSVEEEKADEALSVGVETDESIAIESSEIGAESRVSESRTPDEGDTAVETTGDVTP